MPQVKKNEPSVLAIDLGGTKILTALISGEGQIMAKEYCLTLADEGADRVISRIFSAIDQTLTSGNIDPFTLTTNRNESQLDSISIAAAGAIDLEKGQVTSSPHLPGWSYVPLRDIVGERYRVNTLLLNDANAAALAEHHFGAGRGVNNLIMLTVGTGIGGGIIINDALYSGVSGSAGEIGHMTIDVNGPRCNCGNTGCLEVLVSGTALAREAIKRLRGGEKSAIIEIVRGQVENITAETVAMAAQGGDSIALEIIREAATYLGVGMVNLVNIFNPEMIIVGGGLSKMGDLLLEPARQLVRERALSLSAQAVSVVPARLGDDAGVLGAAIFARQQNLCQEGR